MFNPSVVYFTISPTGGAFYRDFIYTLILKLFNKKIIFHLHGKGISKKVSSSKLSTLLYKFVFKNTTIICLSDTLTYDVKSVFSKKPFVVKNGIPAPAPNITTRPFSKWRIALRGI